MKQETKWLISVVPYTKIPLYREQFFYYVYNEKIIPGTLVSIPLGMRRTEGIVLESKSDFYRSGNFRLKKINSILKEEYLTEKQLELARFISEYYMTSLGIVLKHFSPKMVKARNSHKPSAISHKQTAISLTGEQKNAVSLISNLKFKIKNSKFLLYGPASSGKTEAYLQAIIKMKQKNPEAQFLILVPELTHIPALLERTENYFPRETFVIHSKISKGAYYENWQKIQSGEAKIIIGTRQALFAPFKNLRFIAVDDEHDISYKQWDMTPRYDGRKLAEELAKIHDAALVFASATPSMDLYFRAEKNEIQLLPLKKINHAKPNIEIVDMKKERWDKNFSILSRKLKSELEWTIKNRMQVIIFVNRQGMNAFSACKSCKKVLVCPQCSRALVYQKEGFFSCLHCTHKTSIFPTCPGCGGLEFKNVGTGTQKVEKELVKLFPAIKIGRVDAQTMKSPEAQENIWRDFSLGKLDVLVGTQMITKGWDVGSVGLVGIIDTDSLLDFPDFLTNERAFQNIVQLIGRLGRPGSKYPGKALIQTFHPENKIISLAAENNYPVFFKEEMKEREALKYPPFFHIIKLVYQEKDMTLLTKETDLLYDKIKEFGSESIRIYPPRKAFVSNIRGKNRKIIIIKIKKITAIPKKLEKIIQSLKTGWHIDINPISLI